MLIQIYTTHVWLDAIIKKNIVSFFHCKISSKFMISTKIITLAKINIYPLCFVLFLLDIFCIVKKFPQMAFAPFTTEKEEIRWSTVIFLNIFNELAPRLPQSISHNFFVTDIFLNFLILLLLSSHNRRFSVSCMPDFCHVLY